MSDPTDQNPSDPPSDSPSDTGDDKDLSSLYARGSTEQPSDALDQAILEKARKATARHSARRHRFSGWPRAVSAAAVLVLSVLVVEVIHEEAPEPLSIAGRPAVVQQEKAAAVPAQGLPAPPERLAESRKADTPAAQSAATESAEAPRAMSDMLAFNNEEKDQRQRPAGKGAVGNAITAAPTPSTALPASPEQLAERDAAAPATEGIAPSNTLNRLLAKKEATNQQSLVEEEAPQLAGAATDTMASGVASGDVQELVQEEKHCAHMAEKECLSSAACTLTKSETAEGYQCRFAKDHCELMFRQSEGTKDTCEAKTECVYVPATCYCPPDTKCECAGGEPAQCQKENRGQTTVFSLPRR